MTAAATLESPLRATLYELGLRSDDTGRLAAFYSDTLGYRFGESPTGLLGTATGRRLAILPGAARSLAYAVYTVPDADEIDRLERRLLAAGVDVEHPEQAGLLPGAVSFLDPDGNRFIFGVATAASEAPMASTALRPARLQHVVFASTGLQLWLQFMTDVVGFVLSDRVVDDQGGLRTAFVRCSHEHHSLAVFAASENRLDHHCYEAGDWNLIRDWSDHFAKLRVPLKWGPGRHGPGDNLFAFIHDPDGNWVEISAELEHCQPDRPAGEWPHEQHTLNSWGIGLLRS